MNRPSKTTCLNLINAIDTYIAKADDNLASDLKRRGYKKTKRSVEVADEIEDERTEEFHSDTMELISALKRYDKAEDFYEEGWTDYKDKHSKSGTIATLLGASMLGLVSMLSTEYIKENDPQLEVEQLSERTTSFIDDWSKSLGEKVKTDRLDQLESTLLKGLDDGSSVDKIAKELFDNEIREEYYQCKRIALTEVLRAHSMSQLEAIEQDPSVTHKVWRHTGGGMTSRPNHLAIDGQTVPKDKPFTLIGADGVTYHPSMPHDPSLPAGESINCHCMLERVTDESILGLSLEEREALRDKARDEIGDEWTFDLKSNVDNSSEKFYNLSSKYDTPITNKSISALKKVEINGLSQEQSGYAYTHRKELLKSMQNESVGVEGSICFSMDNKFISTVRVGGYGETPISDAPFNYYAIHNHPDNAVLSPRDLSLFLKREHMIGIESIGNNGTSVTSIVKTVESDIVGYADYVNSIIDEIEKNSDIYTNMEVQELNEICTDLLKRGEDYGFKVTIK